MEYVATEVDEKSRVDRVVKQLLRNPSYSLLQKLFRQGKIKVNGKKVSADFRLKKNDVIVIYFQENNISSQKTPTSNQTLNTHQQKMLQEMIIFENDDFLVLNKTAGLAVQLGSKVNFCVENLLKSYLDKYFLVHRLDKDTTGVLLIAKNQKTARELTRCFREGLVKKTYWAIVDGKINKSGIIKNFIGKSFVSGEEKMTVLDEKSGQLAITKYKPINRIGYFSLLELKPETGRKHQLRVHCAEVLKAPILGDKKYNKNIQHKNLFLHAKTLEIPNLNIFIDTPLPDHFKNIL